MVQTGGATEDWYMDSGSSHHAVGDYRWMIPGSIHDIDPIRVKVANDSTMVTTKSGSVKVTFTTSMGDYPIQLEDVLLIPGIAANLISVSKIQEKGTA